LTGQGKKKKSEKGHAFWGKKKRMNASSQMLGNPDRVEKGSLIWESNEREEGLKTPHPRIQGRKGGVVAGVLTGRVSPYSPYICEDSGPSRKKRMISEGRQGKAPLPRERGGHHSAENKK